MTRWLAVVCGMLLAGVAWDTHAQTEPRYWVEVQVPSAFLRVAPLESADPVSSAAEGEQLEAVGRNADGTWFEVRRSRRSATAWIIDTAVKDDFAAWELPITSSAGVTGEPVIDTGIDVFVLANAVLRAEPFIDGAEVLIIPHSVTLPVVGRNQDASWLRVNYNGTVGWLSRTVVNTSGNTLDAPAGDDLPPLAFEAIIIPPELQLAQVERVRQFANAQIELSSGLGAYWQMVLRGDILPCTPPPFRVEYQRTPQDIRELPELNRWLPRLDDSIEAINASIEPLTVCGAFSPRQVSEARAHAVNAGIMLENILLQLDSVEDIVNSQVARPR